MQDFRSCGAPDLTLRPDADERLWFFSQSTFCIFCSAHMHVLESLSFGPLDVNDVCSEEVYQSILKRIHSTLHKDPPCTILLSQFILQVIRRLARCLNHRSLFKLSLPVASTGSFPTARTHSRTTSPGNPFIFLSTRSQKASYLSTRISNKKPPTSTQPTTFP
jgi:hypothetical protein